MRRLLLSALGLWFYAGACALVPGDPTVLIFHNRSAMPIALYPDTIIEPCSVAEFDRAGIEAGNARYMEALEMDRAWVPPGAVRFDRGIAGRPVGSTEPMTVVISAQAPRTQLGRIPPGELPACGGEPVGVE